MPGGWKLIGYATLFGILVPGVGAAQDASPSTWPDAARMRPYVERLRLAVEPLPDQASLTSLLVPMMREAAERSARGASPPDENRAALLAMAVYVNGWDLAAILPEARMWPKPRHLRIRLRTRVDLARHFTVSALAAASAGLPFADAIGLFKELSDARAGSGFSFSDLAADKAGALFGRLAARSPESARRLQARVAGGAEEDDLMPSLAGLPDGLTEAQLSRQLGGVGGAGYMELLEEIDRRVAALPLARDP